MYIKEVQVKNFGKLKNRQFHFSPGLNVVCGENGAGKSTLQQFLMAMLFGMEKGRGRGSRGNPYDRYEPWEAPSYYAGSMRFCTGGKEFYLERNFYHKEKSSYLINERDREELSVEQGDLQMLLGGVSKEAYENTFFIRQGAVLPRRELGDCLMDELHNLAETGDGGFELSRTFEILQQEKKAQEKRRREAEAKRNRQLELLCAEKRMLEERAEKLADRYRVQKEQIIHMQREQRERDMQSQRAREMQAQREREMQAQRESEMQAQRERDMQSQRERSMQSQKMRKEKKVSLFVIAGLICCIFWLLLCLFMPFSRVVWLIGQAVLLVLIAAGILNGRRVFDAAVGENCETVGKKLDVVVGEGCESAGKKLDTAGEEGCGTSAGKGWDAVGEKKNIREKADESRNGKEEADLRTEISRCRAILEVLAEEQQENEIELENNRSAQREAAESCGQNDRWEQEIQAIALAEETLHSLAAGKGELSIQQLKEDISVIFDQITDGKYGKIELSEKYEPRIEEEFKMRKPEAFSEGTMQQIYFAYRMAAGQFLEQEESLPFLLDEVFSMYDTRRLKEVFCWLGTQKRQIFLFTCQEREAECLRELGIPFQRIEMEDK